MHTLKSTSEKLDPDYLVNKVRNLDLRFTWSPTDSTLCFHHETESGLKPVTLDPETGRPRKKSSFTEPSPSRLRTDGPLMSPSGKFEIRSQKGNLWVTENSSDHWEPLTFDGQLGFAYGEVDPSYDRGVVARRRKGESAPLRGVLWLPGERHLLALRQDFRPFPDRLFVTEYSPPDGQFTCAHMRRMPLPRDGQLLGSELTIIDVEKRASIKAGFDTHAFGDLALHYFLSGIIWFDDSRQVVYLITSNTGGTQIELVRLDLRSGDTKTVLREQSSSNVRLNQADWARPNVYVLPRLDCFVWYSESSGCGHLSLHRLSDGAKLRQLTHGDWVVFDLIDVREDSGTLYFTGSSRDKQDNPYYRYLYSINLEGGEPSLLTPEKADHKFQNILIRGSYRFEGDGIQDPPTGASISPCGRYFVDSYSTVAGPTEYSLRRTDGSFVAHLLTADASSLYQSGWRAPKQVIVKAADGVTDLYGVITLPADFDPGKKYPLIDAMYPGPQNSYAPRGFKDQIAFGATYQVQAIADEGFVVLVLDGRGTAHRSRHFRDAFRGSDDPFGAADHAAAITQLAERFAFIDIDKIGVIGQSFGGYASLRAILLFPDLFKVCASATGPGDFLNAEGEINVERHFGVPQESKDALEHYQRINNIEMLGRLKGKLLLIYGGIDESVPLKQAFDIIDSLIEADKDFDLLIVPEMDHSVPQKPYVVRRTIKFLKDHLLPTAGSGLGCGVI